MVDYKWWEHSHVVNDVERPYVIRVAKTGGGTLGRAYEGEWQFEVGFWEGDSFDHSVFQVMWRSFISTGMPKTHLEVCHIIREYWDSRSE